MVVFVFSPRLLRKSKNNHTTGFFNSLLFYLYQSNRRKAPTSMIRWLELPRNDNEGSRSAAM